ncbi:MAG: hypothetical protein ACI4OI_02070, partial [Gemmiger sp.]
MPRLDLIRRCRVLPLAVRWLLGGVALLAVILLGGVITAYGGTLLVLLLWAICTGGLWLLLHTTWQIAFPAETPWKDRHFRRTLLVGSAVGIGLIAAVVFCRQTIYGQDAINYYAKQSLLLNSFSANGFYGVHLLAENLLTADYKMFLNLFISVPYLFTGRGINAFMVCYALSCFVPAWCALLLCAKKVGQWFGVASPLYLPLCMAVMVLWPMFLWPATNGMPDFFGLAFVGCILLLTAEYRFASLPAGRLICLFGATFALVLTRRWYMFWIVAYYAVYALLVLVDAARQGRFVRTLGNMARFGIPAVLGIVLPLLLTFKTILTTDYSDIYGAYYGGGFLVNCGWLVATQGWLWCLVCLAGLAAALRCGAARWPLLAVMASGVLAMALFTRTQSLGYHQALILAPALLGLLFCAAAAALRPVWPRSLRAVCAAAVAGVLLLNLGASLGAVPGSRWLTGVRIDLTRRTDLEQIAAVTEFVREHCEPGETVYININSDGYSGSSLAFSDPAHPELQSMILYEHSVPSTHGFPTGIWSSRYVMVTDKTGDDLIGRINTALLTDTPAAAHYSYVTDFALAGVTLHCYERTAPPDEAEKTYFKTLFVDYDARWPSLFG